MEGIINFSKIEKKWQKKWEKEKIFETKENSKKKKYTVIEMYPYPSGSGLHMGHAFNYSIGDIQARLKRMQGFNVFYPMGFDSFGLPAENAAIKAKSHPKKFTEDAIKNYISQMKSLGLSYNWSRILKSHNPEYYKWDQWIFLKMLEKGLAYQKKAAVNWCPQCNTVLANEQVQNGKCWRHEDTKVEVKQLKQWFLKITNYADELIDELDKLGGWPEEIKKLQKNWIGRSHGTEIDFLIDNEKWKVFTTRPDTLFGVTFLVVSAQHPKLMEIVADERKSEVERFVGKLGGVSEEDLSKLEKEGVFTGNYAKHPLTDEKIPIWVGNFVVAGYGGGMVMAVPAHDQRDFEFAKKYKLVVKQVIQSENNSTSSKLKEAYTGNGNLRNSEGFDGLQNREAKEHITQTLETKKLGRKVKRYRLRDWLISRQRFWGTPIPIVYCDSCGTIPINEKDLPVKLPEKIKFESSENPLKTNKSFLKVKCPKCGGNAKRETDTMDTFVNSSWYFLRYADSKNKNKIFDSKKVNYWFPIDRYIGGKEHATMHLIYFRFYTKFLRDLGLINFGEPAKNLFNQGMLHSQDGRKMSKSYGNVVLPEKVSEKYGIDTARLFLISIASPDKDLNWDDKGIDGSLRFILSLINFVNGFKENKMTKFQKSKLNRIIKNYTNNLEDFKYNLAVIKLRELFDILKEGCDKKSFEIFLKLLSPICPHVAEELWSKFGNQKFISLESWPKFDEKKIDDVLEEKVAKVDKTVEDIRNILKIVDSRGDKFEKVHVYVLPQEAEFYNSENLSKRLDLKIEVWSVSDKKKYDPEGKSKKVKPGRPGIFVE